MDDIYGMIFQILKYTIKQQHDKNSDIRVSGYLTTQKGELFTKMI